MCFCSKFAYNNHADASALKKLELTPTEVETELFGEKASEIIQFFFRTVIAYKGERYNSFI